MKLKMKAPAKPGANATKKAVLAFYSQLKKYHSKLEELDVRLQAKEAELRELEEIYEEMDEDELEDELDCGCTVADAKAGCDCPDCDIWRDMEKCRIRAEEKSKKPSNDEVEFLEGLFKLKDKRK
jgi:hypothetical protein